MQAVAISLALVAAACSSDKKTVEIGGSATTAGASTAGASTTAGESATTTASSDSSGAGSGSGSASSGGSSSTVAATSTSVAKIAKPGGKMVIGIEAETSSPWRPAEMVCAISCYDIARTVYDSLTILDDKGQAQPYLASKVEHNADYTQWRFTARAGVKFHDGTDFDGAAIVDNLSRHKKAILTGKAIQSVTSIALDPSDPMVAVVTMDKPWVQFPLYLAAQIGFMASPTWLKASDSDDTLKAKPVGTGPFILDEYKPNEFFKAKKNPNYWNKPFPYLDSVEFIPIPDALKRRDALKAGDVDMIQTTNGQTIKELRDAKANFPATEQAENGETSYTLLHVTQEGSPITDVRVRCALAYSEDNNAVNQSINQGVNTLANGPFSPGQPGHLDDSGYPIKQDMAKAKELIAAYKAEHPGKLTLALATTNDDTNLVIANFQKQWFEEAGVDEVTIDQIDQGQYIVVALLGNFQVFQWRNHGGVNLDQQYVWWHSSSALPVGQLAINFGRIKDPQLDALLDENRGTSDPAKQKRVAEDVNKLFAKQCYNLWGWYTIWMIPHKPNVAGVDQANLKTPEGVTSGPGTGGGFYPATLNITG